MKVDKVVMFGLYADMCVSTSVRIASNLGFETYVAADACASVDQQAFDGVMVPADTIFRAHLATLNTEFATVVTTDAVLAR